MTGVTLTSRLRKVSLNDEKNPRVATIKRRLSIREENERENNSQDGGVGRHPRHLAQLLKHASHMHREAHASRRALGVRRPRRGVRRHQEQRDQQHPDGYVHERPHVLRSIADQQCPTSSLFHVAPEHHVEFIGRARARAHACIDVFARSPEHFHRRSMGENPVGDPLDLRKSRSAREDRGAGKMEEKARSAAAATVPSNFRAAAATILLRLQLASTTTPGAGPSHIARE